MSDNQKETKFQIQPYKCKVVDSTYAETTWKILKNAIDEIYYHNSTVHSFEKLYSYGRNMILHKFGEMVYSGLVETMTTHLDRILTVIESAQGSSFLIEVNRNWKDHVNAVSMIKDIFLYMETNFIPRTEKTSIHELGLNLWRDNIVHHYSIQARFQSALLEQIYRERTGEVIDCGLMKNITNMLIDLGPSVYEKDFEIPFLNDSADFYKTKAQKLIECCDCGDYLKKAENCLDDETERVKRYLDAKSESKIKKVVEVEMIAEHMLRLVHMENSGLVKMLIDVSDEHMSRVYKLIGRVPNGIETITNVMTSHIKKRGKKLVTHPDRLKNPVKLVQCILNEKDKYDKIISFSFDNCKGFIKGLNSSFDYFINLSPRSPEFISLLLDDKFRKGFKSASEEDIEIILNKVMTIFYFLNDKDLFEKYYRKHLSKRLLYEKSVSDYAERSLIIKMRMECGFHYTSKLEGMFDDIEISGHRMTYFLQNHTNLKDDIPIIEVKILTTGYWPIKPIATCNLPEEVCSLCKRFKSYYLGLHEGQKLSWQTNMGTAYLRATFGKVRRKKYRLYVSTYQMCVLMLFNDARRLSYKEIEQATEIPFSDLNKCLISLSRNVLNKKPKTTVIREDDMFKVNHKFTSKFYKVILGGSGHSKMEQDTENQETLQRLEEERKSQIQAVIVRIMKTRKVVQHKNVIAEVTTHLQPHFLADPLEIKKCIESLILREFLERDDADRKLYHYLA